MTPYLLRGSSLTVNFFRPLARRRCNTACPLRVDFRARNPCLFFLRRTEGWYVRFITQRF